jgi:hypothetical protein
VGRWKFEISGEKLSDFLEGCYRRLYQSKTIHALKCEEYEARIRLLEEKLSSYRMELNVK